MNFNAVAPYYSVLQRLVFGNQLQLAQVHFLNSSESTGQVLVLGAGTGEFLRFLSVPNGSQFTLVDNSARMCAIAKKRAEKQALTVEVYQHDVFDLNMNQHNQHNEHNQQFDLVCLPFVLDLFSLQEAEQILKVAKRHLKPSGKLIITDFENHSANSQKLLLKAMYAFFGVVAGVDVQRLPNWRDLLTKEGFDCEKEAEFLEGFVRSGVWVSW
jgi:ubiquinone/menaquinone biosynthesis C-methylase UbiE